MSTILHTATAASAVQASCVPDVAAEFSERISHLYGATAFSPVLFASPLGPLNIAGRERFLPRFIHITPKSSEESIRVAVYAGHDHLDLSSTEALLHLLELFLLQPNVGDGLHLSFFPLLDLGGLHGGGSRELTSENWRSPRSPEIGLLARDARQNAYHAFVELRSAEPGDQDDLLVVTLLGTRGKDYGEYADEFLSTEDFSPFEVRFEIDHSPEPEGPLALGDDLLNAPIGLRLTLPSNWPVELSREAVARFARHLLLRYRSHQSYGQHI